MREILYSLKIKVVARPAIRLNILLLSASKTRRSDRESQHESTPVREHKAGTCENGLLKGQWRNFHEKFSAGDMKKKKI